MNWQSDIVKMDNSNIKISTLKKIEVDGGAVLHAMKKSDTGYAGFGEAYFSTVNPGSIKAWKLHTEMTMNLIVPVGSVKFVMTDGKDFQEYNLSKENYKRLTVPPMIWFGFQGRSSEDSLILNIADILHDPEEVIKCDLNEFIYDWSM